MVKNSSWKTQPVNAVYWEDRDRLIPNSYNPNKVYPAEMRLLKKSILENGWTQPIVANEKKEIIDGFHRWKVSAHPTIYKMTNGLVPVCYVLNLDKTSTQMSTIRHNRARGTHLVLKMAEIVKEMIESDCSIQEIMSRLEMEKEEVIRLANRQGIPQSDLIQDAEWSNSWIPVTKNELDKTS
tara:strand:+ start:2585 stop:3130 length:546 start_codon:yes stop_codon:yes gene_type:complete